MGPPTVSEPPRVSPGLRRPRPVRVGPTYDYSPRPSRAAADARASRPRRGAVPVRHGESGRPPRVERRRRAGPESFGESRRDARGVASSDRAVFSRNTFNIIVGVSYRWLRRDVETP